MLTEKHPRRKISCPDELWWMKKYCYTLFIKNWRGLRLSNYKEIINILDLQLQGQTFGILLLCWNSKTAWPMQYIMACTLRYWFGKIPNKFNLFLIFYIFCNVLTMIYSIICCTVSGGWCGDPVTPLCCLLDMNEFIAISVFFVNLSCWKSKKNI